MGGLREKGAMWVDCVRVTRASLPLCGNDAPVSYLSHVPYVFASCKIAD